MQTRSMSGSENRGSYEYVRGIGAGCGCHLSEKLDPIWSHASSVDSVCRTKGKTFTILH